MKTLSYLTIIVLAVSILSYGIPTSSYSQTTCGDDEVVVGGVCVNAFDDDTKNPALELSTDRQTYADGNTIILNGKVDTLDPNYVVPVTIRLHDSSGKLLGVAQIIPESDGTFQHTFQTSPSYSSGEYEIFAKYNNDESTIAFDFIGGGSDPVKPDPVIECPSGTILVGGECMPEEKPDPECLPGETLIDGQCIPDEPPVIDCPPGETMMNGECIPVEPPAPPKPECGEGTAPDDNGICQIIRQDPPIEDKQKNTGSGCLIATAAYGSELAPQVQLLREIRDGTLYSTASGTSFMTGFNQLYYSFSPTVADWERQSPIFKEMVRATITPMISSLGIMELADQGSEAEVLGYGMSVIALNLGMYIAAPVGAVFGIRRFLKSRN